MTTVSLGKGTFEQMLRKFKKRVSDSNVLNEYKIKEYFEKPSDKRRRKHKAAVIRTKQNKN